MTPIVGHRPVNARIRTDLLKPFYAGLLSCIPRPAFREYWKSRPCPAGNRDDELATHRYLWQETEWLEFDYFVDAINGMEPLLLRHGMTVGDFIEKTVFAINRGGLVRARNIVAWSKPLLSLSLAEKDVRAAILKLMHLYNEQVTGNIVHQLVTHQTTNNVCASTLMVMVSEPMRSFKLFEKVYGAPLPPYDCGVWSGMVARMLPCVLDLPPFDEVRPVADSRPLAAVLAGAKALCTEKHVHPRVEDVGAASRFHAFLREHGHNLDKYRIPDAPVTIGRADLYCPACKRTLVFRGCAYGAPVGLYRFIYRQMSAKDASEILSPLLDYATSEQERTWERYNALHAELLAEIAGRAKIVYHAADESISVNGKHLVRAIPAKILRRMVTEYLATGRTDFEYRELGRDTTIFPDDSPTNLAVRTRRLAALCEAECPQISIAHPSRGTVRFEAKCTVEFGEE